MRERKIVVLLCCLLAAMLPLAGCGKPELSPADQVAADAELLRAVDRGDLESAKKWLKKGANVNAVEKNWGQTPLHKAARKGHKDIVELLIAKGANVNAADKYGETPLFWAARNGHKDVAELLRKHGAK